MYYVYFIRSINSPEKTYIGCTPDLKQRLADHNDGKSIYSSKYAPWDLISYTAFKEQSKAFAFEKYLKSSSGKAFIAKHL